MLDMKLLRENPETVKENIRKKFQDKKLDLVDEVLSLDTHNREAKSRRDVLRSKRNLISKEIGVLISKGRKEEAETAKEEVTAMAEELADLEKIIDDFNIQIRKRR